MLIGEVNIIINCAGSVEFNSRLDIAMRINVTGALLLLRLAEQCINFECFCHISTCYAVCDKNGVIEEKMVESAMDWQQIYTSINTMTTFDIEHYQKTLLGNFPNSYTFTKRMAEHLLF
jgi:nucleoside-diphosphate-sugar epimerase